jgi:hypothetical protein
MKPAGKGMAIAAAFIVYSGVLAAAFFDLGTRYNTNVVKGKEADVVVANASAAGKKNKAGLQAGVRAAQAQAKTDQFFQQLRSNYETDQRTHPGAGCDLDDVSLRRWNEANAGPDGAAAGEPAGAVPRDPAAPGQGKQPGQQPYRVGPPVPPLQGQGHWLDRLVHED